jgi:hypothetical protein
MQANRGVARVVYGLARLAAPGGRLSGGAGMLR